MAYDSAGYRYHCGECCHFALDEERTKLRRELFGRNIPNAYYCKKLHIPVDLLDSPNNPTSAAAGCIYYVKRGRA
jgi:hypothetical protein